MDWIAAALSLTGTLLAGWKHWSAWAIAFVASCLWTWIAIQNRIYGMAAVNAILAVMCVVNGWRWWRSGR